MWSRQTTKFKANLIAINAITFNTKHSNPFNEKVLKAQPISDGLTRVEKK